MTEDLRKAAEAARDARLIRNGGLSVDGLGAQSVFRRAANPAAILALYAERDAAIARAEKAEKEIVFARKHMLPVSNDGNYVFIDGPGDVEIDHGGELRKRAEAAEASLAAVTAERDRLLTAMDREEAELHRMIDEYKETGVMHIDVVSAFHRIRDKDSVDAERAEALTKEPPHAER